MAGAAQAGQIARLGFDAVAIDLQHGMVGEGDAPAMVAAITAAGLPAVIRVRWNEPGLVGFALDMGAAAVIAPMVNSAAEAKALPEGMAERLPVKVLNRIFLGEHTEYRVAHAALGEFMVLSPRKSERGGATFEIGDEAAAGWRPEAALILADG